MGEWFARIYDSFMYPLERHRLRSIRQKLISGASGIVLEIGAGTGVNYPFYRNASQVIATEPQQSMLDQSRLRTQQSKVPIDVRLADAQALPFADHTFDTVVCTLALCTIPDPIQALREVRRVCKPDAKVLLLEHVRLDRPLLGRLQDVLTPVWKRLCDGCHLNRDPVKMLRAAGFEIVRCESCYKGLFLEIEARKC
ncbi:methyltransferase domain-containing protein [Cohnella lubricantis]|uniref:Methyltransferase domain-containing protein n=1 Tax=Cohnella lubricantis TaxID=2163172 RepID=A0A841T8R4_9BACL|nr:methyltransferase domain-containing protein [Cohnella lubricantis]MBB6675818.1 methyltransferase domain-containing protein [Cohnella lubricantis]MBP2119772.1 ubiquinone/menaquinone biosynthesis C-methylase UbiE [Cohnella lubricantis]